ncbi:hypothetical protein QWY85_14220 [Neolewinella lacunae]|uniref:Uncharacterized protein n=1 Tax=Neolewinella lacunae TaxID=1517758 RepID=A0A923T890_9BACT|nr:hypothetical protein [Neolewinella lacunae]MBC6994331.1 hypothetical protein [Neolewinella lacunae]MDN3635822.1 hypothetical protein [Neolewinella lacunae]
MELLLQILGSLLLGLALVHVIFPRYFDWTNNLKALSLINRQMMQTHTFFIALTVFLMGLLCLTSADLLISTPLGQRISLGLALFWGLRLVFQLFVYSPLLWRGKAFETVVHVLFTALWLVLTGVFGSIAWPLFAPVGKL